MKRNIKCSICGKKVDVSKESILSGVDFDKNEFICSDTCLKISNKKNFPPKKFKYVLEIRERKNGDSIYSSLLDEEKLKRVLKEGLGWKGVD